MDAETLRDGSQRGTDNLPIAASQGVAQDVLRRLFAGSGLMGGRLAPGRCHGPHGGVRVDLEAGKLLEQPDVLGPKMVHSRLRSQGEGEIAERRQASGEILRIAGDVGSKREAEEIV
ncbi:hypothetical protein D6850_05080 [Roseovarius spongiae]|uniref:Uncharacterized protein n=1 Tax=Roseovarius spongiae TaxID=2320272 RepID=A0A3A8B6P3_9RHOB|nr:hypothetical protein D6850_05080 [Roseovarius spongiae]